MFLPLLAFQGCVHNKIKKVPITLQTQRHDLSPTNFSIIILYSKLYIYIYILPYTQIKSCFKIYSFWIHSNFNRSIKRRKLTLKIMKYELFFWRTHRCQLHYFSLVPIQHTIASFIISHQYPFSIHIVLFPTSLIAQIP